MIKCAFKYYWQRHVKRLKYAAADWGRSLVEALIVMAIIHVPLALHVVWTLVGNEAAAAEGQNFITILSNNYRTADVLAFSTGLLSSSTAYFIVSYRFFTIRPKTMMLLVIGPLLLVYASTPIFLRDLDGGLAAEGFASTYAQFIMGLVILAWLFAIYQQKAIVRSFDDDPVRDIMNKVAEPN